MIVFTMHSSVCPPFFCVMTSFVVDFDATLTELPRLAPIMFLVE